MKSAATHLCQENLRVPSPRFSDKLAVAEWVKQWLVHNRLITMQTHSTLRSIRNFELLEKLTTGSLMSSYFSYSRHFKTLDLEMGFNYLLGLEHFLLLSFQR